MYESIKKFSSTVSFLITVFLTVLFFAIMILVKVEEKPKYKTIKINLSQATMQTPEKKLEKIQEKPESVKQAEEVIKTSEAVSQTKAEVSKQSESVKKTESKAKAPSPKKTASSTETPSKPKENTEPKEKVTPSLVKSQEQLMQEAMANKKQASFDDYDPFADDDESEYDWSESVALSSLSNTSSIEGSAALSSVSQNSTQTSSSKGQTQAASSNTSNALQGLKNVSATTAGRISTIQVGTSNSSDNVTIKTDDGRNRELLSPAKPEIRLSEENAKKISGTVKVNILIKIFADGTVPATYVRFTPASVLPMEVQDEIKNIIRQWRFVSDVSEATATLEYTIQVN